MSDLQAVPTTDGPGPNGATRKDGIWPCQCYTCTACPEPTTLKAKDAAERPESARWLCVKCMKQGHAVLAPIVDPDRPRTKVLARNPGRPDERAWDLERERVADEATREMRKAEAIAAWDAAVEPRFKNATLDEHVDEGARPDIAQFLTNVRTPAKGGINLALVGPLGVGKTYLLQAIARQMVHGGLISPQGVRFGTEDELLAPMTQGLPSDRKAMVAHLTDPKRVTMLFIDEVGRAKYSDADSSRYAWDVITDFAYEHDIPLVIATNLVPAKNEKDAVEIARVNQVVNPFASQPAESDPARPWSEDNPEGGHAEASHIFLGEWLGDAAYDRVLTNTPNKKLTAVDGGNRRPGVADGDVPR